MGIRVCESVVNHAAKFATLWRKVPHFVEMDVYFILTICSIAIQQE